MPIVPASQTVFSEPTRAAEEINASPASFGAAVGAGLQNAGDQGLKAAMAFQSLQNERAATEADGKFLDSANDLKFNPQTGFMTLQGQNAVNSYGQYTQKLHDSFDKIRSGLSPEAQRMFDQVARRNLSYALDSMASHAGQQNKQSILDSSKARLQAYVQDSSLNYRDQAHINGNLAAIDSEIQKQGEQMGWTAEQLTAAQQDARGQVAYGMVGNAIAQKDYKTAEAIIDKYKGSVDPRALRELNASLKTARQADYADQEHAWVQQEHARAEQDRRAFADALPKIEAGQLSNNDVLKLRASPQMQEHLLNLVRQHDAEEMKPTKTDPIIFHTLMSDTLAGKIPDEKPLIDAYSNGQLSFQDFTRLQQEWSYSRTPDGSTLAATRRQFDQAFRRSLDKSELGIPDPQGPENWYNFNRFVDGKIKQYRADGKNPNDLFDPANADYVAKVIPMFQRTPEEIVAAQAAAMKANVNRKAPNKGDVVKGYRFKGGDPASPASWELAK